MREAACTSVEGFLSGMEPAACNPAGGLRAFLFLLIITNIQ